MFSKPATGSIAPSVVSVILCHMPIHAEEHLVHGWDALRAALEASEADDRAKVAANIAYARNCIEHAIAASRGAKFMKRAALRDECIELAKAADDAARYF